MADQQQPSTWGRVWREGVDRAFLGNRGYDYRSGQWDRRGVRQGLIQTGLGQVNPLLGLGARLYFNRANARLGNGGPVTLASLASQPNFGRPQSPTVSGYQSVQPSQQPMPIQQVQLTPQANFQTTNPGITTQGMNLNAFSAARPVTGFSGGYTPFGASRIEGEAAQDMMRGMQMGMYGNRQFNNFAQ